MGFVKRAWVVGIWFSCSALCHSVLNIPLMYDVDHIAWILGWMFILPYQLAKQPSRQRLRVNEWFWCLHFTLLFFVAFMITVIDKLPEGSRGGCTMGGRARSWWCGSYWEYKGKPLKEWTLFFSYRSVLKEILIDLIAH